MTAPLTADVLGDALLPLLAAQGWDTDRVCSPDGLTLHVTDRVWGDGSSYVDMELLQRKQGVSSWLAHVVLRAQVSSVEQAVRYLRVAGVLPTEPVAPFTPEQEPPDGAIVANDDLTQVWVRDDSNADEDGWHWFTADDFYDPIHWDEVATEATIRLYRAPAVTS